MCPPEVSDAPQMPKLEQRQRACDQLVQVRETNEGRSAVRQAR